MDQTSQCKSTNLWWSIRAESKWGFQDTILAQWECKSPKVDKVGIPQVVINIAVNTEKSANNSWKRMRRRKRRKLLSLVLRYFAPFFDSATVETLHDHIPVSTIAQILTSNEECGKYHCKVRVVGYAPDPKNFTRGFCNNCNKWYWLDWLHTETALQHWRISYLGKGGVPQLQFGDWELCVHVPVEIGGWNWVFACDRLQGRCSMCDLDFHDVLAGKLLGNSSIQLLHQQYFRECCCEED